MNNIHKTRYFTLVLMAVFGMTGCTGLLPRSQSTLNNTNGAIMFVQIQRPQEKAISMICSSDKTQPVCGNRHNFLGYDVWTHSHLPKGVLIAPKTTGLSDGDIVKAKAVIFNGDQIYYQFIQLAAKESEQDVKNCKMTGTPPWTTHGVVCVNGTDHWDYHTDSPMY